MTLNYDGNVLNGCAHGHRENNAALKWSVRPQANVFQSYDVLWLLIITMTTMTMTKRDVRADADRRMMSSSVVRRQVPVTSPRATPHADTTRIPAVQHTPQQSTTLQQSRYSTATLQKVICPKHGAVYATISLYVNYTACCRVLCCCPFLPPRVFGLDTLTGPYYTATFPPSTKSLHRRYYCKPTTHCNKYVNVALQAYWRSSTSVLSSASVMALGKLN